MQCNFALNHLKSDTVYFLPPFFLPSICKHSIISFFLFCSNHLNLFAVVAYNRQSLRCSSITWGKVLKSRLYCLRQGVCFSFFFVFRSPPFFFLLLHCFALCLFNRSLFSHGLNCSRKIAAIDVVEPDFVPLHCKQVGILFLSFFLL